MLVFRASPDRAARGPLAAFLALVGANYLLSGLSTLPEVLDVSLGPNPHHPFLWLALPAVFLDPPAMLLFAMALRRPAATWKRTALVAGPAVLILAFFLLTRPDDPFMAQWRYNRLYVAFLAWYYGAAFAYILSAYVGEERSLHRDRLGAFVVAFGVAVLPRIPLLVVDLGLGSAFGRSFEAPWLLGMIGTTLLLYATAFSWAWARQTAGNRRHTWRTMATLGGLLLAVTGGWLLVLVPPLVPAGFALLYPLRWLLFSIVVVSGFRRFDLLDVPERVQPSLRAALTTALVALAGIHLATIFAVIPDSTNAVALLGGFAAAGLGAGLYAAVRRGVAEGEPELAWRRRTVYRAYVELGSKPAKLVEVRARLGVSEREAREVEALVQVERAAPSTTRETTLVEGARFLGRYEIQGFLGVGAFGRAFVAWDTLRGERVVLKELLAEWRGDPEAVERFRREAETLLSVSHPNLVAFRGIERVAGGHVLVLAYAEGETLRARLGRGPIPPAEAARLGADILAGLAALHASGIVHRDVKPDNVVLRPDGRAVLLDFGSATKPSSGTRLSGRRAHPGTPAYMSPEQARGKALGPPSDVYAVGVLMWECLAGRPPPQGKVPPAWTDVLARALAKGADARWRTAEEFRKALPVTA